MNDRIDSSSNKTNDKPSLVSKLLSLVGFEGKKVVVTKNYRDQLVQTEILPRPTNPGEILQKFSINKGSDTPNQGKTLDSLSIGEGYEVGDPYAMSRPRTAEEMRSIMAQMNQANGPQASWVSETTLDSQPLFPESTQAPKKSARAS